MNELSSSRDLFHAPVWDAWDQAFYSRSVPQGLPHPQWGLWNAALAAQFGLPVQPTEALLQTFSGNTHSMPWCSAYAGHQFGSWAGPLGDGRAHTLGTLTSQASTYEFQLKGAGMTPFSRRGDGRAVLRSSVREYLASEAMAGLNIPTTRALALIASPLPVMRETVETAAIVTRVAPNFLRFGHIEHLSHHGIHDAVLPLITHLNAVYYPAAVAHPDPVLGFFTKVVEGTAQLMAAWQSVGFCHGVMNTDNMSLLGLTLDYGPFAFLDGFDLHYVCNHSDTQGRYAYDQQPTMGWWNCTALASALLPFVQQEASLQAVLDHYSVIFQDEFHRRFRAKLGLGQEHPDDEILIGRLLALMHHNTVDFTRFFRALSAVEIQEDPRRLAEVPEFQGTRSWIEWLHDYGQRGQQESHDPQQRAGMMGRVNPRFVLRNHLAELAIRQAQGGDFAMAQELQRVLATPFDLHPDHEDWADSPPDWASSLSLSCSS
ncbi:MAG: YdiU family protein [Ferrovum sp.]|nr:YdiU family protein [Ferrovum sp.]NDU87365.1 YdiU family protein [Ferrovum sp.]